MATRRATRDKNGDGKIDDLDLEDDDTIEPAEIDPEIQALRDRIATLEAEKAALEATHTHPVQAPAPIAGEPAKRWVVSIPDGITWVVEAPTEADAWRAYKDQVGIISTPHDFTARPTDLPAGRVDTNQR